MNKILNQEQILQKIHRIAFEIYENNFEEQTLVLAGIEGYGYVFAEMIAEKIEKISHLKTLLVKISINKNQPWLSEVLFDCEKSKLENQNIVVVDDVLNTGRTLAFSLSPFLHIAIQRLQVAVLIDRSHRLFPISADYIGYALTTTINEHIAVNLEEYNFAVYLD